ncbi:MAG: Site-specific recombinase phage integrase family [Hyphomicrobiales bacterium]|nr:Site-specific recombinase phage integrase family [Hyphomicrobiales bacterium]
MSKPESKKDPWFYDVHEFFPGVMIGKTRNSGGNWYYRYWVTGEGKYQSKSLKTKNRAVALAAAEEIYFDTRNRPRKGEKIFSNTVDELCDWYLEERRRDVGKKLITPGRLVTIRSQLVALRKFLGPKVKVSQITAQKFLGYTEFRLAKASLHTIKNERSTISSVFKLALKHGKISHEQLPEWEKLKRMEEPRRDSFTVLEYQQLYRQIRYWAVEGEGDDEKFLRELIRDFVLICANTGLRYGEARSLRWRHVRNIHIEKAAPKTVAVELFLTSDITKTDKSRTVVGLGGQHFQRRKKSAVFTKPDDFVFCVREGIELSKRQLYSQWKSMMDFVGLGDRKRLTYYSLRHTYATFRIVRGKVHPQVLAQNMGCSVNFLEKHYAHVKTEEMIRELTRTDSKDEGLYDFLQINLE